MMLLIPIPLLMGAQLPLKRKLLLCAVFSLGIFVILAACLNRYYNFTIQYSIIFLNWYAGEVATAVIVANIPLCWPLIRWLFSLDTFNGHSRSGQTPGKYGHASSSKNLYARKNTLRSGAGRLSSLDDTHIGFSESEERINKRERTGWTSDQAQMELSPMDGKTGYRARIDASKDNNGSDSDTGRDAINEHAITKTVQVTQHYTS
jgi:hypothetical protein